MLNINNNLEVLRNDHEILLRDWCSLQYELLLTNQFSSSILKEKKEKQKLLVIEIKKILLQIHNK